MKQTKKFLSVLLAVLMLFSSVPLTASVGDLFTIEASAAEVVASGAAGTNATWTLDDEGTFTISGTGTTYGDYYAGVAWNNYRANIINVVIEDGVTSIGAYIFYNCINLVSITIPQSVTSIGDCAFQNCNSFTVYYLGTEAQWSEISISTNENSALTAAAMDYALLSEGTCGDNLTWKLDKSGTLAISGTGAMKNYSTQDAPPWYNNREDVTSIVVENGVTSIGDYAFYRCLESASVTIPDSITSIGQYAFAFCIKFADIVIPNCVTSIGDAAFLRCDALQTVYFDSNEAQWNEITIGSSNDILLNATKEFSIIEGTCGADLTWVLDRNSGLLEISGTGDMDAYFMNAPWNNYTSDITKVSLNEGITSIGNWAFYNCVSLNDIVIPDSVKNIYSSAFYCCESLPSIVIPDGVEQIGNNAFDSCKSLTSMDIPDSVTYIDMNAFANCTGLTSIRLPMTITVLRPHLFANCFSLTNITIPDSVTVIEEYAFRSCTGLESIEIPASVTNIGYGAFWRCSALASVSIPAGVTEIKDEAFYSCTQLTDITIPDGVLNIAARTFSYCENLTSVTIPASVTTIKESAFNACENLSIVYFGGSEEQWEAIAIQSYNDPLINAAKDFAIVGGSCGENLTWVINKNTGILTISGEGAMDDYSESPSPWYDYKDSIQTVVIEDGVTNIGMSAFSSCGNLTAITIPATVEKIDYDAFWYCFALKNVYFGGSETQWNNMEIVYGTSTDGNDLLRSAEMDFAIIDEGICGENLTWTLNKYTGTLTISGEGDMYDYETDKQPWFAYNADTKIVVIENGVTSIGDYSFYDYDGLAEIIIPDSVTNIGEYAFCHCGGLTNLTIPAGVSSIEMGAFTNCAGITSVTLSNGITSIAFGTFMGCEKLTGITILDSVTEIGYRAFYCCEMLASVTIPASVTYIAEEAFGYCEELSTVYYGGTEEQWNAIGIDNNIDGNIYLLDAPHIIVNEDTIAPTCVAVGREAGEYCIKCAEFVSGGDEIAINPDNHTNTEISGAYAPTCGVDGYTGHTFCFDCETTLAGETIPATGIHSFVYYDAQEPTTEQIGWEAYAVCENCDYSTYAELDILPSGTCGDNLTWVFDYRDGTLTVSGTGDMTDFANSGVVPWCEYRESVTSVVFDGEITRIGDWAFFYCLNLANITIPDSVSSIGYYSFGGAGITNVTIPAGIKEIYKFSFYSCQKLESVTILDGVESIGSSAFRYCYALTSVTIADSVTSIGDSVFDSCTALKTITFPSNLTVITKGMLRKCTALESVVIPQSVTSVGTSAFEDCTSLEIVYFGGSEEQWSAIEIDDYNNGNAYLENVAHVIINKDTVEPTCTAVGYEVGEYCIKCQEYVSGGAVIAINPDNHVNTETVTGFAASCGNTGLTDGEKCADCGEMLTEQEVIPATGDHKALVIKNAAEATYDAEGYTGDKYCMECDTLIEKGTSIPKLERPTEPETPDDPSENCDHMCHSSSKFVQFFWKIIRALQKLFKIEQYCDCGAQHW